MLSLIVAVSQNNALGKDKKMIWYLPDDLKRFKQITINKTIILGRVTFEGLGRKLPNRKHIIITKDKSLKSNDKDISFSNDLIKTLEKYKNSQEEVFIIGGASIYEVGINFCDKLYITDVYKDFEADTYLKLDYTDFEIVEESDMQIDKKSNIKYKYIDYVRARSLT